MDFSKTSKWRGKYPTLKDYYLNEYDAEYYEFDKYQLTIDPDETVDDMDKYDFQQQQLEVIKCANSFFYWCHKYVKILHPMHGLIPFILYKYQHNVIHDYENNRFNIISKFRQGGLTTVSLLWGQWRCMFQLDQQVMILSKTDREATDIGLMTNRTIENFPEWMKPKKEGKWNDHHKDFCDTGGALKFYSPEAARGKSVTFLIVDEAAFIPEMEKHWKAMWPVLSTGGACTLVSTVNGLGNWYQETYHNAQENRNRFNIIDLDYWEHPDYNNEEWFAEQKAQLGEKGLLQEVLREFLGSGDTYIDAAIIKQLTLDCQENWPARKLYPKWVNLEGRISQLEEEHNKGAFWMWKEPVEGHDYIMGVDVAEGQGTNNDSSVFEIIDSATLEQVAEFYSNLIPPHIFAQVVNEVGIYYNTALVVVEGNGPGGAVISELFHKLYYENLFYETKKSSNPQPGIKVGRVNKPLLLQALQNRLIDNTMRVNSIRVVAEMQTFEYNPVTKRAEAQKGKHDDAIDALCLALYVRESILRDIPMGADIPAEITNTFKTEVYEEIRRELQDGAPQDWIEEDTDVLEFGEEDVMAGVMFNVKRRYDRLLREFDW